MIMTNLRGRWASPKGRREAAYFLGFNAANVLNYAYLVLMGFLLGEDSYGLFGALFGIIYLSGALANTVQVTTAKVVAEARAKGQGLPASLMTALVARAAIAASIVGLAALAASPVLARVFHASLGPPMWVSLAVAMSILLSSLYGVLQGLQDFAWLGASILASSTLRLAFGGALILAGWGITGALVAIALGNAAAVLLALALIRGRLRRTTSRWPLKGIGPALGVVLAASLAVAFPTSFDVAVVKHYFPSEEASLFTAISVLGRVVLFVPLALSFIAFPKVASARARGDSTWPLLAATLAPVAALSLGSALVLMALVHLTGFSPAEVDVGQAAGALSWYLMAMVLFSLAVVFTYYNLGRSNTSYVFRLLLPCLFLEAVLLFFFHDSLTMVAQLVFASNALLFSLSLALTLVPGMAWLRPRQVSLASSAKPLEDGLA